MHTHKAIKSRSMEKGWTACVTPHKCAANPARQSAHGNIIVVDVCSCGATRKSEHNGRVNYGEWIEPR